MTRREMMDISKEVAMQLGRDVRGVSAVIVVLVSLWGRCLGLSLFCFYFQRARVTTSCV